MLVLLVFYWGKKKAFISYHSVENQDCYHVMNCCKKKSNWSNTDLIVLTLVALVQKFVWIIKYTYFKSPKLSRELAVILYPFSTHKTKVKSWRHLLTLEDAKNFPFVILVPGKKSSARFYEWLNCKRKMIIWMILISLSLEIWIWKAHIFSIVLWYLTNKTSGQTGAAKKGLLW